MATKNKQRNRTRQSEKSAFSDARTVYGASPEDSTRTGPSSGRRWFLLSVFLIIAVGGGMLAMSFKDARMLNYALQDIDQLSYKEFERYQHDSGAFTQGLFFLDADTLVESTGQRGDSTIRLVNLKTGEPGKVVPLPDEQFGEGCTRHGDLIYQLTWKEEVCHVYDLDLNPVRDISYEGQGWGLTSDGKHLIMSDGTAKLLWVDPEDFSIVDKKFIKIGNRPVTQLNELEFARGMIYANQLNSDYIYEIDPHSGKVVAMTDLAGLWPRNERPDQGVLNGIAYKNDPNNPHRMYVTGKYCPWIYEVEFVETEKSRR